jgi:hypothetical protein
MEVIFAKAIRKKQILLLLSGSQLQRKLSFEVDV